MPVGVLNRQSTFCRWLVFVVVVAGLFFLWSSVGSSGDSDASSPSSNLRGGPNDNTAPEPWNEPQPLDQETYDDDDQAVLPEDDDDEYLEEIEGADGIEDYYFDGSDGNSMEGYADEEEYYQDTYYEDMDGSDGDGGNSEWDAIDEETYEEEYENEYYEDGDGNEYYEDEDGSEYYEDADGGDW